MSDCQETLSDFIFLYREYGLAPDETLTLDAIKVKKAVLEVAEEVYCTEKARADKAEAQAQRFLQALTCQCNEDNRFYEGREESD